MARRKYRSDYVPDVYTGATVVGDGATLTLLRIRVRPCTVDYPTPGVVIQVSNADAKVFSRVDTAGMRSLGQWLLDQVAKVDEAVKQAVERGVVDDDDDNGYGGNEMLAKLVDAMLAEKKAEANKDGHSGAGSGI